MEISKPEVMMKGYTIGMLAVVCALSVACTKKAEEPESPEGVTAPEPSMVERVQEQVAVVQQKAAAKVEEYKEIVVSATRPLEEVKAEAEQLNIDQLKATALKYKDAISAKTAELEPLLTKFKELPMARKLSAEGLQIKDEIAVVKQSVDALKVRYDVYVNKLKEMGVDVSAFLK